MDESYVLYGWLLIAHKLANFQTINNLLESDINIHYCAKKCLLDQNKTAHREIIRKK